MRRWRLLILALLTTFYFTSYAFASNSPRFDEKPTAFDSGKCVGYFLWQDNAGLHLRVTSTGIQHSFSGTIRTDGRFRDDFGRYNGSNADDIDVSKNQNKITYKFAILEEEGGIDFLLSYGSYIKFSLLLDGNPIKPEEIFIGKDGWHPASNEFTLRQDENNTIYSDGRVIFIIGGGFWWPRYFKPH